VFRRGFCVRHAIHRTRAPIHGPDGMIALMHDNGLYDRVKTVHHGHMPEIEILSPHDPRVAALGRQTTGIFTRWDNPTRQREGSGCAGHGNHTVQLLLPRRTSSGMAIGRSRPWYNSTHRLRTDDEGGHYHTSFVGQPRRPK